VSSQTTNAIMAAGRMKSRILTIKMIMAIPMISSNNRSANSKIGKMKEAETPKDNNRPAPFSHLGSI